jgi:acetone carboxylase, beta subunit
MESSRDAPSQWSSEPAEAFPALVSGIYSGTAMLNRLLSRTGPRIGAIVTAGPGGLPTDRAGDPTQLGYSYLEARR